MWVGGKVSDQCGEFFVVLGSFAHQSIRQDRILCSENPQQQIMVAIFGIRNLIASSISVLYKVKIRIFIFGIRNRATIKTSRGSVGGQ